MAFREHVIAQYQTFDFTDEQLRVIQASDPADQSTASLAVSEILTR